MVERQERGQREDHHSTAANKRGVCNDDYELLIGLPDQFVMILCNTSARTKTRPIAHSPLVQFTLRFLSLSHRRLHTGIVFLLILPVIITTSIHPHLRLDKVLCDPKIIHEASPRNEITINAPSRLNKHQYRNIPSLSASYSSICPLPPPRRLALERHLRRDQVQVEQAHRIPHPSRSLVQQRREG